MSEPRPLTIYCDHPKWMSSREAPPVQDIITIWGQPPVEAVQGLQRWWVDNDGTIPRSVRYTVSRRSKVHSEYDLDRLEAETDVGLTHGRWELTCPIDHCYKLVRQAHELDPVLAGLFLHNIPRVAVRKLDTLAGRSAK